MRPARLDHSFFDDEPRSHLGALLLRKGLVTHDELDQALAQREPGELLGEALCRLRIWFENDIARGFGSLACQRAVPSASSRSQRAAGSLRPTNGRRLSTRS